MTCSSIMPVGVLGKEGVPRHVQPSLANTQDHYRLNDQTSETSVRFQTEGRKEGGKEETDPWEKKLMCFKEGARHKKSKSTHSLC